MSERIKMGRFSKLNKLDRLDGFSNVIQLNMGGRIKHGTKLGGILTLAVGIALIV